MRVLGIETTCDETAAAVVEAEVGGVPRILSNVVMSQIAEHAAYGGVVPEIAARAHVETLDRIVERAMREAGDLSFSDLDGIAAAAGPGLIGGVMIGLTMGKALALAASKPMVAVNHLEAHALTARLTDSVHFPYLMLLMSGGHTQLVAVLGVGDYVRLGTTLDDAIGEAFDKVGKLLGLPFPGGPQIERHARSGDAGRFELPRPMHGRDVADFSLSGLKTAVRHIVQSLEAPNQQDIDDIAASFQAAILDIIVDRTRIGLRHFRTRFGPPRALVVAGGVAANGAIRQALLRLASEAGLRIALPPPELCTDNGVMIAWTGIERLRLGLADSLAFAPRPRWPLDSSMQNIAGAKA